MSIAVRFAQVLLALSVSWLAPSPAWAGEPCCAAVPYQGNDADNVMIQLVAVKRTGPTDITVTWQYKNQGKTAQQLTKAGSGPPSEYRLAWEAELLDLGSRTRYQVARTGQHLVAAKHMPANPIVGISVGAGKTLITWAKFIVPEGVSKVTITLPGASQPWEGVAITP